ncbi:MAG: hypothetical protein ACU0C9_13000, partial [Paracoccaceae bacterium]
MLKNLKTLSLATMLVVAGAVSASAATVATFDFQELIDGTGGTGETVWSLRSVNNAGGGWTVGDITLEASAEGTADAYLDAGNAGLGVCSAWLTEPVGQCDSPSDDEV